MFFIRLDFGNGLRGEYSLGPRKVTTLIYTTCAWHICHFYFLSFLFNFSLNSMDSEKSNVIF